MENVETSKNEITDLLVHAIEKRPNEFQDAFNDLLTQRITDRLEAAKQEVAANYFNYVQDDGSTETEEGDVDTTNDHAEEQETTNEVEQDG